MSRLFLDPVLCVHAPICAVSNYNVDMYHFFLTMQHKAVWCRAYSWVGGGRRTETRKTVCYVPWITIPLFAAAILSLAQVVGAVCASRPAQGVRPLLSPLSVRYNNSCKGLCKSVNNSN